MFFTTKDNDQRPLCTDCATEYRGEVEQQSEVATIDWQFCSSCHDKIHDCMDYPVPVSTSGPLGHGWECGQCGRFLQAG